MSYSLGLRFVFLTFFFSFVTVAQEHGKPTEAEKVTKEMTFESRSSLPDDTVHLSAAITHAHAAYKRRFDSEFGGFRGVPKFPPAMQIAFLLRHYKRTKNRQSLLMAEKTLEAMAVGGIYDQLGGGFSQYSKDASWSAPHYTKTLYDNALLAIVYLEAFQVTRRPVYGAVAENILQYVANHMTHPDGGFYATEEVREGTQEHAFYVWEYEELQRILTPQEFEHAQAVFTISKTGTFDGKNILALREGVNWLDRRKAALQPVFQKLLDTRSKRKRPHLDVKIVTSWNALMISALSKAWQVLGKEEYLHQALKAARFLKKNLFIHGQLLGQFVDGEAQIAARGEAYAFLAKASLDLYQSTFDHRWLQFAQVLQGKQDALFWYAKSASYRFRLQGLPQNGQGYVEKTLPSALSVSLENLFLLFNLTADREYYSRFQEGLARYSEVVLKQPASIPSALAVFELTLLGTKELVIVYESWQPETAALVQELQRQFMYHVSIQRKNTTEKISDEPLPLRGRIRINNATTYYVCEHGYCKAPVNDIAVVKRLLGLGAAPTHS